MRTNQNSTFSARRVGKTFERILRNNGAFGPTTKIIVDNNFFVKDNNFLHLSSNMFNFLVANNVFHLQSVYIE